MSTPVKTTSAPTRRKSKLVYLLPFIVIPLIAGGLWLHFHRLHQADASPPAQQIPWAVQTGTVSLGQVMNAILSVATIEAPDTITLAPQIQGTVTAIGPRAGTAVKKGQLLVQIDDQQIKRTIAALEAQRASARANALYAEKQQARTDAVFKVGGVSRAQADQARTAAEAAKASVQALSNQIAALQVQLGYARITAPQDAVVAERLIAVGDTASPGKPVYRLTAGQGAIIRVALPPSQLAQVKIGDFVRLEQNGKTTSVRISRLTPAVNTAGLGVIESDTDKRPFNLPSGSSIAAKIVLHDGDPKQLTVPVASIVGAYNHAHVLTITPGQKQGEPGHVHIVPVTVLSKGAHRAAIKGALKPNDKVVIGQTAVLAKMQEGDSVIAVMPGAAQ